MPLPMISRACPVCHVEYALPTALYESARLTGSSWFCPNGHKLAFPKKAQEAPPAPPKASAYTDALKAANAALKARVAALEADCACALDMAETEFEERQRLQHRLSSARSRAKSLRREQNGGVCPWCHNRFDNLRRHLAAKHNGFMEAQRNIA